MDTDLVKSDISPDMLHALFRQTHDAILKIRQKELRKLDLTTEQLIALVAIKSIGEQATAAQLSKWLFRNADSIGVLLSRLEKKGLILRTRDTHRKNINRLSLTALGLEATENASKAVTSINIFSRISSKERKRLWSTLERLRKIALKELQIDEQTFTAFFESFKIMR